MTITIFGRPITKKNHGNIITNPKTKKPMLIPSKQYRQYEQDALKQIHRPPQPIDYPCNVECKYYMPDRRRVDLANLIEATTDVFVKAKVLEDDNCKIVATHDGSEVLYDKGNPRAVITITRK